MESESEEPMCFWRTWRECRDGLIDEETKLRHALAHLYGTRHADDETLSEMIISEPWAEQDIVSAAVMVCMINKLPPLTVEKDQLVALTLRSRDSRLEDLRRQDHFGMLDSPLLYQLIVAAAFTYGNRSLVREMMTTAPSPAPPGHNLLFSPPRHPMKTLWSGVGATFGGKRGYGHAALHGQADNGCDLLADMIEAGWATPREYMHSWAASADPSEAGIRLMEMLLEHQIPLGNSALMIAQMQGRIDTFRWILQRYIPKKPSSRHDLLCRAAYDKSRGVEQMQLLFEHGVEEINWRLPPDAPVSMPMYREDAVPYRTPLHNAASCGNVAVAEWLINHGAEPLRDYFRMDPYDLAKSEGQQEILRLFEKYPDCRAYKREKTGCVTM